MNRNRVGKSPVVPEFEAFRAYDPAPLALTQTEVFKIRSEATMYQITQTNPEPLKNARRRRLTRKTAIPIAAVALIGVGTAAAATDIVDDWVARMREENTIVITQPLRIGPADAPYCFGDLSVVSLHVPGHEPTEAELAAAADILADIDFAAIVPRASSPYGDPVDLESDPLGGYWHGLQIEFNDRIEAAGIDPAILNFASGWGCSPDLESALSDLELNARIDLEGDDNVEIFTVTDFVADDTN